MLIRLASAGHMKPKAPSSMIPVDPFDRRARPDPYPVYQYIRTVEPVHHSAIGYWILTRFEDCRQVLEDPRWSHQADSILEPAREEGEPVDPTVRLLRASVLFSDPPHHSRHRRPLEAAVKKAMKGITPRVTRVAEDLVTLMIEKGTKVDLIHDYASPLAVVVIGDLLGLPAADRIHIQRWSRDMATGLDPKVRPAGVLRASAACSAFIEYLLDRIDARGAAPEAGILGELTGMPRKLRTWDLIADLAIFMTTGLEATTAFIGNAALALIRNPDERRKLAGQPDLINSAVEELLRFDGPIHLTARAATDDVTIGGRQIAAGEQAVVLLGAANRDPARFTEPDRLDITRQDNGHLAFGAGTHACLAAPLARLIGGAAVQTLAVQLSEIESSGEPAWLNTVTLRGLSHLPVTLQR